MSWLKKEYNAFKSSKTIRFAYLKKLAGLVSVILAISGNFEASVDPMWFGVIVALLGMADNKLRKLTSDPLESK